MLYKCIEFHCNIFDGFRVIERTRFVTDRRTDRRTGKNNMSPDPSGGDIIPTPKTEAGKKQIYN